jgi:hypothetical protein
MVGYCQHGNETLGITKGGEFLDQPCDYQGKPCAMVLVCSTSLTMQCTLHDDNSTAPERRCSTTITMPRVYCDGHTELNNESVSMLLLLSCGLESRSIHGC